MKNFTRILYASAISFSLLACNESIPVANSVTLVFNNTFKDNNITLGDAQSSTATKNTSAEEQIHHFSELKYVISNIRLVKVDGSEIPYNINNLDKGATVIDQSKPASLAYSLNNIPSAEYKQLKFGLGIKRELNYLDEMRFPKFYAAAGANDTKMMWEWGTGYRFTKIEGFYDSDNKALSIHTGSTLDGEIDDPSSYVPGVDAYRDIVLTLPQNIFVGKTAPKVLIKADFDKLLSGKTTTVKLHNRNALPSEHTADNMVILVDNLGGNGKSDLTGIFSIVAIVN